MSMDKLMLFRTIYLRTIAEAWADPGGFGAALVHDPAKAMSDYFDFTWPWDKVCKLTILPPSGRGVPPLAWVNDQWVWARNSGEGLTLYVPLSPPATARGDAGMQSRALADWYRQRSSLFSDDWNTQYGPRGPAPDRGQSQKPSEAGASFAPSVGEGSPPPDGGYMPASQDFTSFKIVLVAAIAKAWGDPGFATKLQIDAATALRDIRGYELPWDLGISLCNDASATWTPPDTSQGDPGQGQSYWSTTTLHELKLLLPATPVGSDQKELACAPLALAMYNAAGAEYPFTCCCDP